MLAFGQERGNDGDEIESGESGTSVSSRLGKICIRSLISWQTRE